MSPSALAHRLLSAQFTPLLIRTVIPRVVSCPPTSPPSRPIHSSPTRAQPDNRPGAGGEDPLFRPSPPPLPAAEQREFEDLVRRAATGQFSSSSGSPQPEEAAGLHPDYRPKPADEFEGDVNPKTGEVGGPKREPVRHNDWSYGGRATDF